VLKIDALFIFEWNVCSWDMSFDHYRFLLLYNAFKCLAHPTLIFGILRDTEPEVTSHFHIVRFPFKVLRTLVIGSKHKHNVLLLKG